MYFEVNGKQVFATTGGKPFDNSKPVIIFLAGSALDHTFWGLHSRFFAFRKYAVLALDTPGHTNSEGPALASIEALGDWLNAVVEALALKNVSIVAHSQGCLTALEYASRYPDKLRSLSLITSGLATPVNDYLLNAASKDPEAAIAMMVGWGFGTAGHLHQGPIPGNSMIAAGRKVMRKIRPMSWPSISKPATTTRTARWLQPLLAAQCRLLSQAKIAWRRQKQRPLWSNICQTRKSRTFPSLATCCRRKFRIIVACC